MSHDAPLVTVRSFADRPENGVLLRELLSLLSLMLHEEAVSFFESLVREIFS